MRVRGYLECTEFRRAYQDEWHQKEEAKAYRLDELNFERVAEWIYEDENRNPLIKVKRFHVKTKADNILLVDPKTQKPQKIPVPYRWVNNRQEYVKGLDNTRRTLLYLPELIEVPQDEIIYIVEGETCAEFLKRRGFTVTTNMGGSNGWKATDPKCFTYFKNRNVVILPDNDEAGEKHLQQIYVSIKDYVASIKVLRLPRLKPKQDIVDWNPKITGEAKREFSQLVADCPLYEPPMSIEVKANDDEDKTLDQLLALRNDAVDLTCLYDKSPPIIKDLTRLLCSFNTISPPPGHYFTSLALLGAMAGKKLLGQNQGQDYYCNNWLVCLSATAQNKSAIRGLRNIVEKIYFESDGTTYATLEDRFTVSHLFSEIGNIIPKTTWLGMDDAERKSKKRELIRLAKEQPGYVIMSDEFALNFESIMNSGPNGRSELATVLQLADSGAKISGGTSTGGYRLIADCCLSMIGYTQDHNWYQIFDADMNLESGLIGRFFIAHMKDYVLEVERETLTQDQGYARIYTLLSQYAERLKLAANLSCNFCPNVDDDFCHKIFTSTINKNAIKPFIDYNLIDINKIKGKVIYQAIKDTMLVSFLMLTDEQLNDLKTKVEDGWEHPGLGHYIETDLLRNEEWYAEFMKLKVINAIKLFSAEPPKSDKRIAEEKIIKYLTIAPRQTMSKRELGLKNIRIDGFRLRDPEFFNMLKDMEKEEILTLKSTKRGSLDVILNAQNIENHAK